MTKVLVTGGEGFIGSHLIDSLVRDGYQVCSTCNYTFNSDLGWINNLPKEIQSEIEIAKGDIRDSGFVNQIVSKKEIVFHLAALIGIPYSYVAPYSYVDTNIKGTLNILEAAKNSKCQRIIVTSTSEVYGSAQTKPIDENHPLVGQSPYSASKIAADALATSYNLSFDTPITIIRPFNTYGPRQSLRAVIPSLILQFLNNETDTIRVGSLNTTRDFNFVGDTVRGFISAAKSPNVGLGPFNLATGQEISISEVIDCLIKITGKQINIEIDEKRVRPDRSEVQALVGNSDRALNSFSWKPLTDFTTGLNITLEWFQKNNNFYENFRWYHT